MKTAILGCGSLIWDPRELAPLLVGPWRTTGPVLPIEFVRISNDGRLTLAIDAKNGVSVPTRFAESSRQDLQATVEDLRHREGTSSKYVGFINRKNGTSRAGEETVVRTIEAWADEVGVDGVVWTDLRSNFSERSGVAFSTEAATNYVMSLKGPALENAIEYITKAPDEVDTPVRRLLKLKGAL